MEILSTGEKIKRIRVYNGITLKELCGTEISISKMSCIENGKIEADTEILKYISDKLKIDFNYLSKSVYDQIKDNVKEVEENLSRYDYEKELKFNLEYAIDYGYIEQGMEIINKLFRYYKKKKKWGKLSEIIPIYYDLYSKTEDLNNQLIYLFEIGDYLFLNEEYDESGIYFARILDLMKNNSLDNTELYAKICCELSKCHFKLGKYIEGEEVLNKSLDLLDKVTDRKILCEIYHVNAIKNILMQQYSKENRDKACSYAKDDIYKIIDMKSDYVKCYFKTFNTIEAEKTIEEIIPILQIESTDICAEEFVKFLKILKQYNQREYIQRILDDALNIAIVTNNIQLMEYSYYLKGALLEEEGKYEEAEMNFNLSLDALARFGTKKDFYERYLDLGNLYYKLDNLKESVRYFCLAMDVKNKCNY
ncbi:helix-turn-helix domain-containing protein [Clostridium thermobutyricum]|uniref:Helix-turn-helix domain protein n=1 Tax=Clostridium thermobutyricum DSM 4928 TaxID=1121339 RepID=A0A1V4SY70_9CLOT|nr:helix-turn-helix transcriptional regulator [Clostridium thermobutyricum]OPX48752.1 helix-turn-helix domain protein [Clostridium thermobutyricum DSM 4928]